MKPYSEDVPCCVLLCRAPCSSLMSSPKKKGPAALELLSGTPLQTGPSSVSGSDFIDGADLVSGGGGLYGRLVLLFFGANWCPASKRFKHTLSRFAMRHKDKVTVVVCSADMSATAATAFLRGTPFLMVPYHSPTREGLIKQLRVSTFPSVLVLDAEKGGQLVTDSGRSAVQFEMREGSVVKEWLNGRRGISLRTLTSSPCLVLTGCALAFLLFSMLRVSQHLGLVG